MVNAQMNKKLKRKIAVLTGARAEYGLLKPIMEKIRRSPGLTLQIVVTGSHLSAAFGSTYKDIINDGFKIDARVPMYSGNLQKLSAIPISLGRGLIKLTLALEKLKPDFLLVLGDRGEPLMGAIAAAYLNIPIAHIHGGDQCVGADIDDNIRHCVTKLAHLHFPATQKSGQRIQNLGEEKWRIYVVGAPGLDTILKEKLPTKQEIARLFKLDITKPVILLLQHAVSSQIEQAKSQMEETMQAIMGLKLQTIVIYPNVDPGNASLIKVIEKYRHCPFLKIQKSLPHQTFLGLMKTANAMVGNSSSTIIEAPSFGLPVVDIGIRQAERERADNIINVPHQRKAIEKAIKKALTPSFRKKLTGLRNPYGNGTASQRIVKVLERIKIDQKLLHKKFIIRS